LDPFVFVAAALTVGTLMLVAGRYGYHRDELYFLQAGRHLDWSYVDLPAFVPAIARLVLVLFKEPLLALRAIAALAAGASVLLSGMLAREFGGRRWAQRLSCVATATAPAVLGAGHLFGPTIFDLLGWSALALVVTRLGRNHDDRLWLVAGAVVAVGLTNKHQIGVFAGAIVVGVALSGGFRRKSIPWALGGAAVAIAGTVPEIWWQVHHGWATLEFSSTLHKTHGGPSRIPFFFISQLALVNAVTVVIWLRGLVWLWRSPVPEWRGIAIASGIVAAFLSFSVGLHSYYFAPMYVVLFAAGGVAYERRWEQGRGRRSSLFWATAAFAVPTVFLTLPMLPLATASRTGLVNPLVRETMGWPEFLRDVSTVWHSLTPEDRKNAVIFTDRYAEAGAINELGSPYDLPKAVSGHDSAWWWGAGNPDATTVVAVAPNPVVAADFEAQLRDRFADVRQVLTLRDPTGGTTSAPPGSFGSTSEEVGGHVWVCRQPKARWSGLWATLRQYGPS
jgi:hypothetical protein